MQGERNNAPSIIDWIDGVKDVMNGSGGLVSVKKGVK